jgi:uncharacterized protein (DUF58 family)
MVLVGLVAVLLPMPGAALLGGALWVLALTSWRWSVAVQRGITVTWTGPSRVQPDATTTGTLTVRNASRWPVGWLEVTLRLPANAAEPHAFPFVLRLGARTRRSFDVRFVARDRGVHQPRELSWRVAEPFGLSSPSGVGTWRGATLIVPRLAPVRRMVLESRSPLAELAQPRSLFVDRSALVGVRAYERGDPLSSIHWPATARTGQLMRTEHERAAARELLVCLDLATEGYQRRGRPPVAEAAISTAAARAGPARRARRTRRGPARGGALKIHPSSGPRPQSRRAPPKARALPRQIGR